MKNELSRRQFVEIGCRAGAGVLFSALTGCAPQYFRTALNQEFLNLGVSEKSSPVGLGMYDKNNLIKSCEEFIPKISDMSWLSKGDSVFLKVACNSDKCHPVVTHPEAIIAVADFLKSRGAGKIYAGDQSGVETVRLTETGRVSSTRKLMEKNGILEAVSKSGSILHCFDDQGWNGYFNEKPDFKSSWNSGIWLPETIKKVDHIIYLPRLGTHAIAGYTCAVKNAVGWLRDDSRMGLHQKGDTFFEKFAEINHFPSIRKKLRLSLTIADSALLNIGPDMGSKHKFKGFLFLGSENPVNHDYLASMLLQWYDKQDTSVFDMVNIYPKRADMINKWLVKKTWGEQSMKEYKSIKTYDLNKNIEYDSCLSHLAVLQGYRPGKIIVKKSGGKLPDSLYAYIAERGKGLLHLI